MNHLQFSKCDLNMPEVLYLGHIVFKPGVAVDPKKVSAVQDWPVPKNLHDLRCFLGLTNYFRTFIQGYSARVAALTCLQSPKRRRSPSLERMHRVLQDMLRHYVDKHHDDWDEYLATAEFAINSSQVPVLKNLPSCSIMVVIHMCLQIRQSTYEMLYYGRKISMCLLPTCSLTE